MSASATGSAGLHVVGVVGAGTMGAGIAQVAAIAGHHVLLFDARESAATSAIEKIRSRIAEGAQKGRWNIDARAVQLEAIPALGALDEASLVIEAIVEDFGAKRALFAELDHVVSSQCILATNTSSLSPTALAAGTAHPRRIIGLHFFNPVPLMRLVEVVPGLETAHDIIAAVTELAQSWGKTTVRATATPGFIVNRDARPFYAEAWRLWEEHAADPAVIDTVLTRGGGFRMGPFALMDLIGHDVNEAVTRSVWSAFCYDARFAPSPTQRQLVEAGWLGRKAAQGVRSAASAGSAKPEVRYPSPGRVLGAAGEFAALLERAGADVVNDDWADGPRLPSGAVLMRSRGTTATESARRTGEAVVMVDRTSDDAIADGIAISTSDRCPTSARNEAIGLLQAAGLDVYVVDDVAGLVATRTVAMIVNLAVDALQQGVATAEDIDTAMRLGTSYPHGPLAWGKLWGFALIDEILRALQTSYGDPHYRPSPLLRREASLLERLSADQLRQL